MELDKTLKETLDEFSEVENNKLADLMLELQEAQTKQEINAIKTKLLRIRSGLYPTRYIAVKEDFPEFTTTDAFNNIKKELEAGYTYSTEVYNTLNRKCTDIIAFADSLLENTEEHEERANKQETNSYQELRERLTTYISITTEDLKKLIEGQPLQKGAAKWIGKPIEAYRFAYWLNPEGTERHKNFKAFFNNNIAGVKVHGNQSKGLVLGLEGSIWDILKQYRPTKGID